MKQKLIAFSQNYLAALRKQLKQGPSVNLQPALEMGRAAVAIGVETLQLARIHEQALVTLELSALKNSLTKLAGVFFTEANSAIVETHDAAQQSKIHLSRMKETLGHRTAELAVTNRELQRGVIRRKVMEEAAETTGQHYKKCLEESLKLQKRLRQLTHRVLLAQEDDRKKISRELQNQIAQTLLGINARLLTLKTAAKGHGGNLTKEIASTQQLVVESIQSINQFARELDVRPQMWEVRLRIRQMVGLPFG
jgi:signal transduction histidine kinase